MINYILIKFHYFISIVLYKNIEYISFNELNNKYKKIFLYLIAFIKILIKNLIYNIV